MNYFTLDGHSTSEWGIGLSGTGVWDAPARKGESISVPGRNGNVWVDDGSFENIYVTYPCWMSEGFDDQIDDFRGYLSAHADQYYRLTDTYHPDEYRMARYAGPFTTTPGTRNESGRFDVVFDCWPQRTLLSGEVYQDVGQRIDITNPTRFGANPLIHIKGTGDDYKIHFHSDYSEDIDGFLTSLSITFLSLSDEIWFDTRTMSAQKLNARQVMEDTIVEYTTQYYVNDAGRDSSFTLWPGRCRINLPYPATVQPDILEIMPRWWKI